MKTKLIHIITLITILSLLGPNLVLGQEGTVGEGEAGLSSTFFGCTANDTILRCLSRIAGEVFKILSYIAIVLAVILFIFAGFTFMLKGKEEEGRKKAQNQILYAAIGLVVALVSLVLTRVLTRTTREGI
jgi:heme A synthase